MMKAVKKLKFWSRKKKKRKNHPPYYPSPPPYPPPPPPCHHCCSCSSSTEPSAPPLPPWLEQNYGTFLEPSFKPAPEVTYPSQAQVHPREIVVEPDAVFQNVPVERSSSYQQYMVPKPVYGIPITQTAKRERSGGLFGCVFSVGAHLFRCLFPCFHIREV